jgi:NADPH:quinone reductase-like Zn-dependent oxidoreductase
VDGRVERLGRDGERDETTCYQVMSDSRGEQMTMRACGVDRANGPVGVFELAEPPDPGPGEVLIKVHAAGMGPWDALLHTGGWDVGLQYPGALGVECSGSVLAVGADVTGISVGDEILAREAPFPKGSGFWTERALITAVHVAKRPKGLDRSPRAGCRSRD